MTASAVTRNTPRMSILGIALAALSFGLKALEVIPEGVIGALDTSGRLVNATADRTLRVVGRVNKGATGSAVDLATLTEVEPGCFPWASGGGADAITVAHLGKPCFIIDNQTVGLTDAAGTRPFAGIITQVDGGKIYVAMLGFYDPSEASKNEAGGEGAPLIQGGTGVLVAGVLVVNAGVQITANSRIVVTRKTPGGTFADGGHDAPAADRVVGEPGVGAFTIRARAQDGTAQVGDTSTVDWIIFG